jgi:hypothetical protein
MLVDSLVVELGLDPKKFDEGQRRALAEYKKTKEAFVRGGKDIEDQAKKSGEAIGGIKTQTLQLFTAVTGAAGLVQFAAQAIHAGAAVGRLSRNLGVSVEVISRFQGLANMFGGSAEGMAQSFIQISDALAGWKIGDVRAIVADFRALGAAGGTIIDINKGVEQTFLDIAKNLRAIHDTQGPAAAGYWQRRLGLDPGLFDAMIQKGENFNELLKRMRALTDAEADAASRLEQRWNNFTENAKRAAQGMVLDLVDSDSKFNPLKNGSDAKDLKMIGGWIDSLFGTHLVSAAAATPAPAAASTAKSGAFTSQAEKEAFIRSEAAKRGINPDVAMAVARSEGFNNFKSSIPGEESYSAFQLHLTPGGRGGHVGDQFQKDTGLDVRDPANERAAIMYALDDIRAHGWGAYHGAANSGIGAWAGIDRGAASTSNNTSITINGPINVVTQATDAKGIAGGISSELKRQSYAAQANDGQN